MSRALQIISGGRRRRAVGVDQCGFFGCRREAVSIAGTSGVGKTDVLHLLGGLDIPDSGSVAVGGRDWSELGKTAAADWRNKHLGFVFSHLLLPEFSALENTAMPLLIRKTPAPGSPAPRRGDALSVWD